MITRFRDWSLLTERIKQWFKPVPIIGYKVFESNLTCRGYQYTIGKTHIHKGPLKLCSSGFHYCLDPIELEWHYPWIYNRSLRICEIEAGKSIHDTDKSVTNELTIIREIPREEMAEIFNKHRRAREDAYYIHV